jgi:signal transduction histidine kinase
MGEGVTGAIAATGESAILPNIDPDLLAARAPAAYRPFLERFPAYALIGAPLRVQGRVIGTVTATRFRRGESYTVADLRLLEELAERAAIAIENGRLYQETLDARTRAEQLYRFAQAVMAADRLEVVFEAALSAIETALGAKRSAILTFDDQRVMRFRAWRNLSERYRAAVEGHSPWPPDATAPEPVLVPDPNREPTMASYLPLFEQEGIGALAFIPLVTAGRLLGKFMVYYGEAHTFASHELATARAIANHLASVTARFAAVAKLEETIRYNEIFAGVLAHDLRNPLGAILNAAQLVLMRREGEPGAVARDTKPLGRIIASGQRMTTMIDQLLDLTRARSGGGIEIQLRDANLAELCAHAVGELETAHAEWNIRSDIVGDLAGSWDPERLLQVLSNLVANAGQHGVRDAGIAIRLDGSQREHVTVEVHNKGAVPESLLPHLFDPFRSTRHGRDQSRGLGLGLFIVREIVNAHGGTVEVSSSEAAGTTFVVRLPRHAARPGLGTGIGRGAEG